MQHRDSKSYPALMQMMLKRTRNLAFGLSFICLAFALSGCSGCSDDDDKCADVTCEAGVCSPDSGKCVNADNCGGEDGKCLEGYTCSDANKCDATIPCSNEVACEAGVCEFNACVNKDACGSDIDCVSGFFCGDSGVCEVDPCTDGSVTCDRGVCQKGTGECVNEVVCTQATEESTCLAGFKCYEQKCTDETTYCGTQDCQRGTCDFENGGCADAADCAGDDNNCLEGNFCNSANTCEQNKCDANNTNCPRGVCEPTTGVCVDKAQCSRSADCLDGKLCVGDVCVEEAKACGDEGCPGNQECFYDDVPKTAQCVENTVDGCNSAIDCQGTRVCTNGQCDTAPAACREDTLEENDDMNSATPIDQSGLIVAATCSGDADYYTFNTRDDSDQLGKLLVRLDYNTEDIGLGTLTIEVLDPNNNSVQKASAVDGTVTIQSDVTVVNQGAYTIVVTDEGDVAVPGVRYNLYADVLNTNVITACQNPPELTSGVVVNSSSLSGVSAALTSSCADVNGEVSEDIYKIVVAQDSYVKVQVTPDMVADLSVSLRSECLRNGSEFSNACSERGGVGQPEEVGTLVPAGTYFAVVQGPAPQTGGFYDIEVTIDPAICTSADNTCKDANTATVCNELGTMINDETCDSGCNIATGRCNRPAGDTCIDAKIVDINAPLVDTINWQELRSDYDPGANGCVEGAVGPDKSYQIVVPPNYAISATLTDAGNDVSMYIVTSCGDVSGTCEFGVDDLSVSDETLFWANPDQMPRTVYLIADSIQDTTQTSTMNIQLTELICTTGQAACTVNASGDPASHVCNDNGTAFENLVDCPFGCDMMTGLCNTPSNDRCDGALTLVPGVQQTGVIETYKNDYPLSSSGCTGFATDGGDAIYKITLAAYDTLTVDMFTDFDGDLWIASSCDAMGNIGQCAAGIDDALSSDTETLTFVAPAAGDYFIVAQAYSSTGTGNFTVDATVTAAQCVPGQNPPACTGASTLQYCDGNGQLVDYTCDGTCTGNACDTPSGDICIDAKVLAGPSGSLVDQAFTGTNAIEVTTGTQYGGCFLDDFETASGPDTIYAFDLAAGDQLVVNLESTETDALVHIFEDCFNTSSCVTNNPLGGSSSQTYFSAAGGRVFVVVDLLSGTSTSTYDLSWNIKANSVCAGNDSYCVDATTVARCNQNGDGTVFQTTCAAGCVNGACTTDYANVDVCATVSAGATDIGEGISLYFNPDLLATNDISMASSSCTGSTSTGNDMFYKVTVNDGEILHVKSASYGGEVPVVYIFSDCADAEGTCKSGSGGTNGVAEAFYANTTGGAETLIVGIDSTSSFNDENFEVTIEKLQPQCVAGSKVCNADGTTLQLCNSVGIYDFYTCDGACNVDACANPRGDVCFDSKVLDPQGGSLTGNLGTGTSTLTIPEGQTNGCFIDSFDQSDGFDTFYSISLNAGDAFKATLTTNTTSAHLFLLSDCTNPRSCLKNIGRQGSGSVSYYATQAETIFVVVDSTSTFLSNDYTLDWSVQTGANCASNSFRCVDATTLGACNGDGTLEQTTTCAAGCEFDACKPDVAKTDTCALAADPNVLDVGAGIAVYAVYGENMMTDDINLSATSCVGETTPGPDLFYKVVLQPDEILRAYVDSYGDEPPSVYAIRDCANPDTSCVAGSAEVGFTNRAELFYVNKTGAVETLIVGADNDFSTADEAFGFFIEKRAPECTPNTATCDVNNAGVLLACNSFGLFEQYNCDGGCTGTSCDNPTGDVCADTIALSATSGTLAGEVWDTSNTFTFNSEQVGGCFLDDFQDADGPDKIYSINLNAGDTLDVTLVSAESDALAYILTDCYDTSSCVENNPDGGNANLRYNAIQAQTVFIVVDLISGTSTDTYDLSWNVTAGQSCAADRTYCVDANTLAACNGAGTGNKYSVTCASGCAGGACNVDYAATDVCADVAMAATDIGAGITVYPNFDLALTDDVSFNLTACGSTGTTSGNDTFYKVVLQPGESVLANVLTYGGESPAVYIISDCAAPDTTCKGGSNSLGGLASASYTNTTNAAETLIVGVDATVASSDEPVIANIEVLTPQCTPGTKSCDTDGQTLLVCNGLSQFEFYGCNGSCTGDACDSPTGEICFDATTLAGPSGSVSGDFQNDQDFDPGLGSFGGCYVDAGDNTDGGDIFYKMDLAAGDVLTLELASNDITAAMYLFDSCSGRDACLANLPLQQSGTITYFAPSAQTVYVAIDNSNDNTTAADTFTLRYQINSGKSCAPRDFRCIDATTLGVCNRDGTSEDAVNCPAGCANGACQLELPLTDTCVAVADPNTPDVGTGISVSGNYGANSMTNDIDMGATSCANARTDGPDVFYKVILQPGEVLHAYVDSYGDEAPLIYAITDCTDAENTCVAGSDEKGTTNRAEIYYVNQGATAETVIVGADSEFSTTTADEPFGLVIEKLQAECQPGAVVCDANNPGVLLSCNTFGINEPFNCDGGCTTGACNNPQGNVCFDAITLALPTGVETGDFSGSDDFILPEGRTAGCFIDSFDENDGPDTFYKIDLAPGDSLSAALSTDNSSAYLFLIADCTDPSTCLKNNPQRGSTSLSYYATVSETIYLVVDSTVNSTSTFTLNYNVLSGQNCASGEFRCIDATTLGLCNGDATLESTTSCSNGCADGACNADVPTTDLCASVADPNTPDIGDGIAVYAVYGENMMTNDIDMASSSCVGQQTDGVDLFYKVTLQPDEVLHAYTDSYGDEDPLVYAITDCTDPEGSCLAGGQETGTSNRAELYYANDTGNVLTIIVGADTEFSTADEPFGFFIEKLQPVCQPGQNVCGIDGNTLRVCNTFGLYEDFTCNGGCSNAMCGNPTGDFCFEALPVNAGGTVGMQTFNYVETNFQSLSADLTLGTNGCLGTQDAEGQEKFYAVELAPGQTVSGSMTPDSTDVALYVVSDCTQAVSCLTPGAEAGGFGATETTSYTNNTGSTQTVYVVADAHGTGAAGGYSLDLTVQ